MLALVDADTPVFAAAVSSIDLEEYIARSRLDKMIEKIMDGVIDKLGASVTEFRFYVSGKENFRKDIYPYYKSNRPPSPEHRVACHNHLIRQWDAIETKGYEADDAVGCEQNEDTVIVGIDKDLRQIAGRHYSWPITRLGKIIKPAVFQEVTYIDGLRDFYHSALTGDKSDNILQWYDPTSETWKKNKWALGDKAADHMLAGCTSEEEMYQAVYNYYMMYCPDVKPRETLNQTLDLLWIWRSYGETFTVREEMYGI